MVTEIADLYNIALKTGSTQKEVQKELNTAITNAYLLWTHKESDPNIEINVDFLLGKVSIYKNGNNITPKEFDDVAQETVRKTLINIIKRHVDGTKQSHKETMTKEHTPLTHIRLAEIIHILGM